MATTASDYRTRIDELELALEAAKRRGDQFETRAMQAEAESEKRTIEGHLRVAAYMAGSTEGPIEAAVADAMRSNTWKLDSKGKLLRVLPDGQWDMTADGQYRTALSWMRDHAKRFPSYFPNAQAAAPAAPSTSSSQPQGSAEGPNPWTAAAWSQAEQSKYENAHGLEKAKAMAAAAGVDVYAVKPASPASAA